MERIPESMMLSEAEKRLSVEASKTSAAIPCSSTCLLRARERGISVLCPGSARVAA